MKTVQKFSKEYLERCRELKPEQIIRFLEEFRVLHARKPDAPSRLISIKIAEDLLEHFKAKAALEGVRYQTQIKKLMRDWVLGATD